MLEVNVNMERYDLHLLFELTLKMNLHHLRKMRLNAHIYLEVRAFLTRKLVVSWFDLR